MASEDLDDLLAEVDEALGSSSTAQSRYVFAVESRAQSSACQLPLGRADPRITDTLPLVS